MVRLAGAATKKWQSSTWAQWLLAVIIFLLFSWFYMGQSLTSCSNSSAAFASDSSGGVAWFQWVSGNRLSWGYSDKSNYPIGESVNHPQSITSEAFDVPYRILATMTTPICGLNLMTLLAYMSGALTMFGLVKWLFGRQFLAYFAGYAAAFVPFHQLKAETHVVYAFSAIFTGIIWALLWYVQRPGYKRIGLLVVLTALGWYFDGYFILFTSILVASLLALNAIFGFFAAKPKQAKKSKLFNARSKDFLLTITKHYLFFVVALLVLVMPIAYVNLKHGSEIQHTLSSARGNIQAEAKTFGARPAEFLLPAFNNPIMPAGYETWRLAHQHYSNTSEDTLYIGVTIVALGILSMVLIFKNSIKSLKIKEQISYRYLIGLISITLIICLLVSLPSKLPAFGHILTTPTDVLIKFTADWRVFSRFFLVIDPLAIILAAAGIWALTRRWSNRPYACLLIICFGLLFAEYLTSPLRPFGNLYKDSPPIYHKIAADKSVSVVAEYPLTAQAYEPAIFTFQQLHGKALVNANDSAINLDAAHQAIAGINDIQAPGVLKARGVDLISSYGLAELSSPNFIQYAPPDKSHKAGVPTIYTYRLNPSVQPSQYSLETGSELKYFSVDNLGYSHRVLIGNGSMMIEKTPLSKPAKTSCVVSFGANPLAGSAKLKISQSGKILFSQNLANGQEVSTTGLCADKFSLSSDNPIDITNLEAL